jgi:hypothetical protein
MSQSDIILEVRAEVKRAETLHPHWPPDPIHGAAIVSEESGEAIRAALRSQNRADPDSCHLPPNALGDGRREEKADRLKIVVDRTRQT